MLQSLVCIAALSIASCSDDDGPTIPGDNDEEYIETPQPTEDVVETLYNGKVAIIEPISDEILSFLTKRLPNATTELTDDAEVVIIDETNTDKVSADATTYAILQKLWDKNKIFLFINPKEGSYALEGKLQQNGVPIPPANDEDLATFENIRLYATRADGTSFYHEIPGGESCGETGQTVFLTKQDSVVEVQIPPTNDVVVPSNYLKGRLAENFAAWLNDFAKQGEQRNIAFSRATSDEYPVECKTLTYHDFVKVSHDWIKNCNSKAKIPSAKTIDAKSQLVIYAAYSKKDKSDLYDVNVYQEFDAAKSYVPNTVVHKHGLYKDKYTGGVYEGPTVWLRVWPNSQTTPNIELEQIAPLPQAGQYNLTHYPMQTSIGGALQGNVSASDAGFSGGLSFACTLPYTTVSFNHSEMPIQFTSEGDTAHWTYSTNFKLYSGQWGFNPQAKDIPDIVHSFCHTDQAVSFVVKNTQNYGDTKFYLNYFVRYKTRSEYATNEGYWHRRYYKTFFKSKLSLPKVSRFFQKYTPSFKGGYTEKESEGDYLTYWATGLQPMLMNSVNYRALCDQTLSVGAQKQQDLAVNATKIWRQALEALVTQYNGTKVKYPYAIILNDGQGKHLPLALVINTTGTWEIVENIDK